MERFGHTHRIAGNMHRERGRARRRAQRPGKLSGQGKRLEFQCAEAEQPPAELPPDPEAAVELPAACPAVRLVQKTGKAAHRGKVDIVGNAPRRIMFARLQCGGQQHGQLQQPIGTQRRAFRLKFTHGGFGPRCIQQGGDMAQQGRRLCRSGLRKAGFGGGAGNRKLDAQRVQGRDVKGFHGCLLVCCAKAGPAPSL